MLSHEKDECSDLEKVSLIFIGSTDMFLNGLL